MELLIDTKVSWTSSVQVKHAVWEAALKVMSLAQLNSSPYMFVDDLEDIWLGVLYWYTVYIYTSEERYISQRSK